MTTRLPLSAEDLLAAILAVGSNRLQIVADSAGYTVTIPVPDARPIVETAATLDEAARIVTWHLDRQASLYERRAA